MSAQHRRGLRLTAGRDKQTLTDQEMREREIIRVTRLVAKLERDRRKLRKRIKELSKDLRAQRRLQRHLLRPLLATEDLESPER
jgi:hypothetical protein